MSTYLRRLWSNWSWKSKPKEEPEIREGGPLDPSSDQGWLDSDTLKKSMGSFFHRRLKKKLQKNLEEKKIEKEHDVVVVPADGICFLDSESESDDSDWSTGWLEPHVSITESDDSFAVLVPCYGHRSENDKYSKGKDMLLQDKYSKSIAEYLYGDEENRKKVEQWFTALKTLSQLAIF